MRLSLRERKFLAVAWILTIALMAWGCLHRKGEKKLLPDEIQRCLMVYEPLAEDLEVQGAVYYPNPCRIQLPNGDWLLIRR